MSLVEPKVTEQVNEAVVEVEAESKGYNLKVKQGQSDSHIRGKPVPVEPVVMSPLLHLSTFPQTDIGNAEMFAYWYKGKIKYDHTNKRWLIWNGIIWKEDKVGAIVLYAKSLIRERRDQARVKAKSIEETTATDEELKERKAAIKEITYCMHLEEERAVKSMLRLASAEKWLSTTAEEWDADLHLLGVQNGVVNLRTGELIVGDSSCKVTKQTRYSYRVDTKEPELWNLFLHQIFESMEGAEDVQEYVSRYLGYCLSGRTNEQCLLAFLGEGDNGKSILLEVTRTIMGDYAYSMPFSTLEFKDRSQISNDIAALVDKRLVIASETQENVKLNEARIKSLTGDEAITARFLNKEFFTFRPQAKFCLAFNHKPTIVDDSYGFWRRFRLLNLPNSFKTGNPKRIENLQERLLADEGEAIFNWLVGYCSKWYVQGLGAIPIGIIKDVQQYKQDENPVNEFIGYRCVDAETDAEKEKWMVKTSDMYETYVKWCKDSYMRYWLSRKSFTTRMQSAGYKKAIKTNARVEFWLQLRLKTWEELETENVIRDEGLVN